MFRSERELSKGLIAGLVGGFSTVVMTRFQNAWNNVSKKLKNGAEARAKEEHTGGEGKRR
jgi:hypothetical protein